MLMLKLGYSVRVSFSDFVKRYRGICYKYHENVADTAASCAEILKKSKLTNFAVGQSKVLLKYYHPDQLFVLVCDVRVF